MPKQYELLWVARLTHRFLSTLEKCNTTLDSLTQDIDLKNSFSDCLTRFLTRVSEETNRDDKSQIIEDINTKLGDLEFLSSRILFSSPESISSKITKILEKPKERIIDKETKNFMKYISDTTILKSIPENEFMELVELWCQLISESCSNHLSSLRLTNKYSKPSDTFSHCLMFVKTYIKNILTDLLWINKESCLATTEATKTHAWDLDSQREEKLATLHKVLLILRVNVITELEAVAALIETITASIETEAQESSNKKNKRMYKALQKHIKKILLDDSLLEQVRIVVASIASSKKHRMSVGLNNIYNAITQIYHDINRACKHIEDMQRDKFEAQDADWTLTWKLRENLLRFIAWTLSKVAHSFVKIDAFETSEENKADKQSLMKSKLLSGGIEDRFIY